MMPFLVVAAASADLDALDSAVARCDRNAANPVFAAEAGRRSQFLIDVYKEQESIVNARLELANQRQLLREAEADAPGDVDTKALDLQEATLDARMRALHDRRSLEAAREQAMDAMRHYFLLHCPAGRGKFE